MRTKLNGLGHCGQFALLFLWLSGGRQDSVQAQIHGRGAVVVGPASHQKKYAHGAGALHAAEVNIVAELGIVEVCEGGGAEVEGGAGRGEQFVLGIGFLEFVNFGGGNIGNLGAETIVRLDDVDDQVAEAHLIGSGLVAELVGGHGVDGGEDVFLPAGQGRAPHAADGGVHSRHALPSCTPSSGRSWGRHLGQRRTGKNACKTEREKNSIHFEFPFSYLIVASDRQAVETFWSQKQSKS